MPFKQGFQARCDTFAACSRPPTPIREELKTALPERPFTIEFWDGTAAALDQRRRAALPRALAGGVRARAARPGPARAGSRLRLGRARGRRHRRGAATCSTPGSRRRWTAARAPGSRSRRPRAAGLRCPPRPPQAELRPRGKRHSRERDARSVRHHYDLPPEFFALFLGPSMTYSCAIFSRGATTLEEAQETKLEMVCTKLGSEARPARARRRLRLGQLRHPRRRPATA